MNKNHNKKKENEESSRKKKIQHFYRQCLQKLSGEK
jgi:hypothetical protein